MFNFSLKQFPPLYNIHNLTDWGQANIIGIKFRTNWTNWKREKFTILFRIKLNIKLKLLCSLFLQCYILCNKTINATKVQPSNTSNEGNCWERLHWSCNIVNRQQCIKKISKNKDVKPFQRFLSHHPVWNRNGKIWTLDS